MPFLIVMWGNPVPELEVPLWALQRAIREVDRLGSMGEQRTKFGSCIPLCFVGSSSRGCLAGTASCTIDPWGNVRPCNHAPQIAGNLLTQSLATVWRSATMEAWRDLVPDECETCSAFSACHGGCRADAVLKGLKRDPLMTIPLQAIEIAPPQLINQSATLIYQSTNLPIYQSTNLPICQSANLPPHKSESEP